MTQTEVGRQLEKQQMALHALNRDAKKANGVSPAILFNHIVANEHDETLINAIAMTGRGAMTYEFFALLTGEVEKREKAKDTAGAKRLGRIRDELLEMQRELQQATQAVLQEAPVSYTHLDVYKRQNYYFVEDAPNLLRSFAEQAAIAVRNARLYQQVNQEKQRLDAILEQSADGVMILDAQLRITVFNRALSHMTGWPAAEAIGCSHDDVIRWRALKTESDLNAALAQGLSLIHI